MCQWLRSACVRTSWLSGEASTFSAPGTQLGAWNNAPCPGPRTMHTYCRLCRLLSLLARAHLSTYSYPKRHYGYLSHPHTINCPNSPLLLDPSPYTMRLHQSFYLIRPLPPPSISTLLTTTVRLARLSTYLSPLVISLLSKQRLPFHHLITSGFPAPVLHFATRYAFLFAPSPNTLFDYHVLRASHLDLA